jgi:diadenosine tetraphosphate (Ap4A) HIT family hydrolase/HKD family nuclease
MAAAETGECVFCAVPPERITFSNVHAVAMNDAFPVSPGHCLVIPRRHVADWWELSDEERDSITALVDETRTQLLETHRPPGFNVGFNDGAAAGQTVFHFHMHVIPRYEGDVPDPRGGVRHVIPAKANYLDPPPSTTTARLLNGPQRPLGPVLADAVDDRSMVQLDAVVSFVMQSGIDVLQPIWDRILDRGGRVRILTSDYLGITEKLALERLLHQQEATYGNLSVRIFQAGSLSFHPKTYLVGDENTARIVFTGSANASRPGLMTGHEWTLQSSHTEATSEAATRFQELWESTSTIALTTEFLDSYEQVSRPKGKAAVAVDPVRQPFEPTRVQREALAELDRTRGQGFAAGLVVMATGLGKTWLSAFDSSRPQFRREQTAGDSLIEATLVDQVVFA